jgi:hypothetical protein
MHCADAGIIGKISTAKLIKTITSGRVIGISPVQLKRNLLGFDYSRVGVIFLECRYPGLLTVPPPASSHLPHNPNGQAHIDSARGKRFGSNHGNVFMTDGQLSGSGVINEKGARAAGRFR